MRGSYLNHWATTPAVEKAAQEDKEAAELRLARIQNGAEPGHKNGPWEQAQKVANVAKSCPCAGSPRKAKV